MIFCEQEFHPEVRDETFKRFLRCPPHHPFEGPLAENAAWARAWYHAHGRPWFCAAEVPLTLAPQLALGGHRLESTVLAEKLAGATAAVIVAVSAGAEAEGEATARWEAEEPDRYFFLDSYAAAVVAALLDETARRLKQWAGERTVLPFYCPGYRGWPISDMPVVLAALRATGEPPGPLDALSSGMLRPKKSQLALFGLKPALALGSR